MSSKSSETNNPRLFSRAGAPMRIFLMNTSIFILLGIWLTGFDQVHWFIYFIPAAFTASALFGICPGINMWRVLLNDKQRGAS